MEATTTIEFETLHTGRVRWLVQAAGQPQLDGSDTADDLPTAATDAAQWIAANY